MAATIIFFGPDKTSHITAVNASGVEVASFFVDSHSRSSFTIVRQVPNAAPVPICTAEKSSLSSTTTMNVHGQEVKFDYYHLQMPMGKFTWRSDGLSGDKKNLLDPDKQVVAHADLKEMKLSVLVRADEIHLDCLLAGWVAFIRAKNAGAKIAMGLKIIGALAGGGGA